MSPSKPKVLLVTSDRAACGIREYGRMLAEAVSPHAEVWELPSPHPNKTFDLVCCPGDRPRPDVIHLNHHAALHSAWTPEHVSELQRRGYAVVVTQHDTFETAAIMAERGFPDFRGANLLVVHEQVEGLLPLGLTQAVHRDGPAGILGKFGRDGVVYLRQPVPKVKTIYDRPLFHQDWRHVLGLFGFDFPHKNFRAGILGAKAAGWGVLLLSPNLTIERAEELQQLHPNGLEIVFDWLPTEMAVRALSACDATAFLYTGGGSGTSGAIRLGIAAHRPLLAAEGCRQFRDLALDHYACRALAWVPPTPEGVAAELEALAGSAEYWVERKARVRALAFLDDWSRAGFLYGAAYEVLAERVGKFRAGMRRLPSGAWEEAR